MSRFRHVLLAGALVTAAVTSSTVAATAGTTAHPRPASVSSRADALPPCPHFSTNPLPGRQQTPWIPPKQQAPAINLSSLLPPVANFHGELTGGTVNLSFDAVPGATAYRVFRNSLPIAWKDENGSKSYAVSDDSPCEHADYQVLVLGKDSAPQQPGNAQRLGDDGKLAPFTFKAGSTLHVMATAYNGGGTSAVGYPVTAGICAVDTRVIPWGTRFTVPGYGHCLAADIGTAIEGDTVDVYLDGQEASDWGVQFRDIVFE